MSVLHIPVHGLLAGGTFEFTLSSNSIDPNISDLALAAGWNGLSALVVNITAPLINRLILSGLSFPNGIRLNISASTLIGGMAGGGDAFTTNVPVTINNLGTIAGGGGNGGGGGYATATGSGGTINGYGGSGGNGQGFISQSLTIVANTAGSPGTSASWAPSGGGSFGGGTGPYSVTGGNGGGGGQWGMGGASGGNASVGGSPSASSTYPPYGGGNPGAAVRGNTHVTWIATGTRLGIVI